MSTKQLIDSAVEHLRASASVKTVYGEPVVVDGKTIIPVARVGYGFGSTRAQPPHAAAGTDGKTPEAGAAPDTSAESAERTGGGVSAKPVGVVEISNTETKFVRFGQTKALALAASVGAGLGFVFGALLGKRNKA